MLEIGRAVEEDLDRLLHLHEEARLGGFFDLLSPEGKLRFYRFVMSPNLDHELLVAREKGVIRGFAIFSIMRRTTSPRFLVTMLSELDTLKVLKNLAMLRDYISLQKKKKGLNPSGVHIDVLVVDPHHLGKKIGTQLIGCVKDYAEAHQVAISVDTRLTNERAIKFYLNQEFRSVSNTKLSILFFAPYFQ
jgi:ribosomal protein S18 acetylase RimI-like enzyme